MDSTRTSSDIPISLVYEDELSGFVLRKILPNRFIPVSLMKTGGITKITSRIQGFNKACAAAPFLVLIDLDAEECAPSRVKKLFPHGMHPNMIFRIAVREVEAWLLADAETFSKFTKISEVLIPPKPDEIVDPKQALINLVRAKGLKRIREAVVPLPGSTAPIGRDYNSTLSEYVMTMWRPHIARKHSPSLNKAMTALESFCIARLTQENQ